MNHCVFIGRLGAEPETRQLADGSVVCRIRLAMSKKWKDKTGETKEATTWATCIAYYPLADTLAKWARKGNRVAVAGSYEHREYQDKNGNKAYSHEFRLASAEILDWPEKGEDMTALVKVPLGLPTSAPAPRPSAPAPAAPSAPAAPFGYDEELPF